MVESNNEDNIENGEAESVSHDEASEHVVVEAKESPVGVPDLKSTVTLAGTKNENLRWYVVHTYSGYEDKAKKALEIRAREKKLEGLVGTIHIPQTQKETTTKTGKKRVVSRISFPGYIIAQLDLDTRVKHLIKDTPKITGFVGDNINPKPLPDHEVMNMLSSEDVAQAAAPVVEIDSGVSYNKGDAVRVIDGPFSNFDGVIDEVRPEKAKVKVLVSIFGRETPVELDYKQIEEV